MILSFLHHVDMALPQRQIAVAAIDHESARYSSTWEDAVVQAVVAWFRMPLGFSCLNSSNPAAFVILVIPVNPS